MEVEKALEALVELLKAQDDSIKLAAAKAIIDFDIQRERMKS